MNPASNTRDCFREFLGMTMTGLLFDAFPLGRRDLNSGSKTLIFEDGRGLTISSHGTYWIESAKDVAVAIERQQRDIAQQQTELARQAAAIPERPPVPAR